jgi:hypothetical protein
MPDSTPFELTPEVTAAVVAHMNADHLGDSLAICRHFAEAPMLSAARLVSLDSEALEFEIEVDEVLTSMRIPWLRPLEDRADIRAQLKEMTFTARGITVAPDDGPVPA